MTRFPDVAAFEERALAFLAAREAEHCLILGLCSQLRADPNMFGDADPYFAVVERDGSIALAAVRTPPHNVVLSDAKPPDAASVLARDLAAAAEDLPGVVGERDVARAFADEWTRRTGTSHRIAVSERTYMLRSVIPPRPAPGTMRTAEPSDHGLLVEWLMAFWGEVHGDHNAVNAPRVADRWLRSPERTMYLWEHSGTVSMCGVSGRTPNGVRIGPVYTPPEHRGRGYASSCVAAASQLQLDRGRRFCFLFTDLANPTSNHIYQAIGYRPVCDVDEYHFAA